MKRPGTAGNGPAAKGSDVSDDSDDTPTEQGLNFDALVRLRDTLLALLPATRDDVQRGLIETALGEIGELIRLRVSE